ncbi:MAG TPA: hypothetical protein DCY13_04810 [Verrucomicrobiales bacterium]|nr:hypothetical protein [Verrucomicrobiales bacterium]
MASFNRKLAAGGIAIASLIGSVSLATATDLFFDDGSNMSLDSSGGMGSTELFQFGFGQGTWGREIIAPSGNTMALLVATDNADTGGHGLSAHVDYPFTNPSHGPLVAGNVLRLSAWIASDAAAPVNRQDWQFAILKFEFHEQDLGSAVIFDTDQDRTPPLVTRYDNQLSTTQWKQFVLEYEYNPSDFSTASLQEVRGVVIQGDFEGRTFNGNVVVDNIRVEIFDDAAAAAASPVNSTNPGPLPVAFVFNDVTIDPNLVPATVVSWDGQTGVRYRFEYSDDGGSTWADTGVRSLTGTGDRMQVTDPAGPVSGRSYRIVTPDPVPRSPAP